MAENIAANGGKNPDSAINDPEHNLKARRQCHKNLHATLIPLEEKLAAVKEEIKGVRQQFKADTGIALADFDAARRLAQMDDSDERQGKLDNFMEIYNTLMPGQQISWLEAANIGGEGFTSDPEHASP